MTSALTFQDKEDVKQLDMLSGLLVVLFALHLMLFYSLSLIKPLQEEIFPNYQVHASSALSY